VIIIALHRQPETSQPNSTPKEAGPGKNNTGEDQIRTHLKVFLHFYQDRKAKIRIPELTSSLLSFKAFLQNQVLSG
jgi:hypothetical protein